MEVYLYNCKHCKTARRVEYPIESRWGGQRRTSENKVTCAGFYRTYFNPATGESHWQGDVEYRACPKCQKTTTYTKVSGVVNPEVKCSAKCMNARRGECECACGGKNHGNNW